MDSNSTMNSDDLRIALENVEGVLPQAREVLAEFTHLEKNIKHDTSGLTESMPNSNLYELVTILDRVYNDMPKEKIHKDLNDRTQKALSEGKQILDKINAL